MPRMRRGFKASHSIVMKNLTYQLQATVARSICLSHRSVTGTAEAQLGRLVVCVLLGIVQGDVNCESMAVTIDRKRDRVTGVMGIQSRGKILGVGALPRIKADNEVAAEHDGLVAHIGLLRAAMKAGFLGSSAGKNPLHQDAVVRWEADLFCDAGADLETDDIQ